MYYAGGYFFKEWSDMLAQIEIDKGKIEQAARGFLVENHVDKMPINPEALACNAGLRVRYAAIPGNRVGRLNRADKLIVVDDWLKDDWPYARCVIAHELGHWCLEENDTDDMDPETRLETKEVEASLFARALLMPKPFVEKAVELYNERVRNNNSSFDSIVEYFTYVFEVTERKARLRLKELGYV